MVIQILGYFYFHLKGQFPYRR